MGVYRGVLLDLHKNRLARYQKNQIAKQKAEKDKRTSNIALLKTEVPVHEENGKYYITNKKGELEEVDKGLYDSQVERNRLAQVARGELEATYNIPPTLQKQREDHYNTEAEKFKAQEADSIKSEAEFARRKAEALKNKPIDKVVNEAVVKEQPPTKLADELIGGKYSSNPTEESIAPRKDFTEKHNEALVQRAQFIAGKDPIVTGTKDPNKVASQTMTPNIMSGQNHPQATNLLTNNNIGGMVVGQAPNTGIQSIKQGAVLADPNFSNVKANPFKTRQDSMFGGKIKPTPLTGRDRIAGWGRDPKPVKVREQLTSTPMMGQSQSQSSKLQRANQKVINTMGGTLGMLLSKPSESVNKKVANLSSTPKKDEYSQLKAKNQQIWDKFINTIKAGWNKKPQPKVKQAYKPRSSSERYKVQ